MYSVNLGVHHPFLYVPYLMFLLLPRRIVVLGGCLEALPGGVVGVVGCLEVVLMGVARNMVSGCCRGCVFREFFWGFGVVFCSFFGGGVPFHVSVVRSGNSFTRLWRSVTPLSTCSLKRVS